MSPVVTGKSVLFDDMMVGVELPGCVGSAAGEGAAEGVAVGPHISE